MNQWCVDAIKTYNHRGLIIAVLGYDNKLSEKMLRYVVEQDTSCEPKIIKRDSILMKDGTYYKAVFCADNLRGYCFDQIIIVDDDRWMIFDKRAEDIDWLYYLLRCSCVPEEYQVVKLEYKIQ